MKYPLFLTLIGMVFSLFACEPVPKDPQLTAQDLTIQTTQNTAASLSLIVTGGTPDSYQVGIPANGTLSGIAPNLLYTPAQNFFGTDTFTFSASNATGSSNSATVTIEVSTPPLVAANQTVQTTQNTAVNITLEVTGGTPQSYQVASPGNGTLTGTAPNLTYTPALDYFGSDQFTFTASDGTNNSNTATVTITVSAPPLTATDQTVQTSQNTPVGITLNITGGVPLTYQVGTPGNGTLTGTAPNLTYTPTLDYIGSDQFTFSASDANVTSNTATVSINVVGTFPILLRGGAPEESTITYEVTKPTGAVTATVTLVAFDANVTDEGELIINGNTPIILFGADGTGSNKNLTASINLNTPASHWNNGANLLTFRHVKKNGFNIEDIIVSFQ